MSEFASELPGNLEEMLLSLLRLGRDCAQMTESNLLSKGCHENVRCCSHSNPFKIGFSDDTNKYKSKYYCKKPTVLFRNACNVQSSS